MTVGARRIAGVGVLAGADDLVDDKPLEVLRRTFGYEAFRGRQREIIDYVAAGGDALVLMPTGGGKSLCYQIPALVREGTGVVISPLIALMQDQVDALTALGVRAGFLNSTQDPGERRRVETAFLGGELDLLYLAPERLRAESAMRLLDRGRIALFAIDEAHCVAQWGHDFRPDYLALSALHERWPDVPRIALTATATEATRAEIADRLNLAGARHFVSSFDRPNISYRIVLKNEPRRQLLQLLRTEYPGQAGIVYCLSRASVDKTAEFLTGQGIPALPYHAGLDAGTRAAHQSRFLREDGLIMVATIAFGMGIDKPDVRFVAHLDMPRSVEGYYQETGRAGRDGLPSVAWLAYGLADVVQQRRMIDAALHKCNFDLTGLISNRKLRSQIGYAMPGSFHDKRMQIIMHNLKISLALFELCDSSARFHTQPHDRVGVEFDLRTIGEPYDFLTADRRGVSSFRRVYAAGEIKSSADAQQRYRCHRRGHAKNARPDATALLDKRRAQRNQTLRAVISGFQPQISHAMR